MSRKQLSALNLTEADMLRFVANESDFAFELQVLNCVRANGYDCEHAGSYVDPLTGKYRQFDIRAQRDIDCEGSIGLREYLSIECKNLRKNNPLLVSCVRVDKDSSQDTFGALATTNPLQQGFVCDFSLIGTDIGRSVTQVGIADHDKTFVASQSESYPKISQAMSSGVELVDRACAIEMQDKDYSLSDITPMLVVPDGTLWKVVYDEHGGVIIEPEACDSVDFYFGQRIEVPGANNKPHIHTLRSLKIVQFGCLGDSLPSRKISLLKQQFDGENPADFHVLETMKRQE